MGICFVGMTCWRTSEGGADAPAYQPQGGPGGRPQMDMSNLRMDQHPPRVLGAPAQSYPPGPVTACDTCHDLRRSP